MRYISEYLFHVWDILIELAPWLTLGFLVAGVLHAALPRGFTHRKFGGKKFMDVARASALGVPLPLCSCGVIPAAIGLKKDGASNGAATGFLISTPQTGVDSVMVSGSFLGWPFALFRVTSALIMGLIGGSVVNLTEKNLKDEPSPMGDGNEAETGNGRPWYIEVFSFGFGRLFRDIYGWIAVGVLAAALIGAIVPENYFAQYKWMQGLGGMLLMLLISLPLYVCATASVPIAAQLIQAGLPLGSALVFLMAGPASNVATIGAIMKAFGKRVTAIYLGTVILLSIFFGWAFQSILSFTGTVGVHGHVHIVPFPLALVCAALLVGLLALFGLGDLHRFLKQKKAKEKHMEKREIKVMGMTCQNCVSHVRRALMNVEGISSVDIELDTGRVQVSGDHIDSGALEKAVTNAGYRSDTGGDN